MYRKRWTLRALGMDLRSSGDRPGRWKPIKMICALLLPVLLHGSTAYIYMANNYHHERVSSEIVEPSFDTTVSPNVTGLAGETVQLACGVRNLGNRTVSWVRHRDIHLLTVGRYTYTSDQRFEAMHKVHTEEWILRIRYPQRKDSGIYECQISTTPPIGHSVYLTIVEPVTEIAGGPDLFINKDSTINLTCYVRYAPEPPSTIIWSHNHQKNTQRRCITAAATGWPRRRFRSFYFFGRYSSRRRCRIAAARCPCYAASRLAPSDCFPPRKQQPPPSLLSLVAAASRIPRHVVLSRRRNSMRRDKRVRLTRKAGSLIAGGEWERKGDLSGVS